MITNCLLDWCKKQWQGKVKNRTNSHCVFINILQRNMKEGSAYVSVQSGFINDSGEVARVPLLTWARVGQSDTPRLRGIKAYQPGWGHTDSIYCSFNKNKASWHWHSSIKDNSSMNMEKERIQELYSTETLFARGRMWAKGHTSPHPQTHTRTPLKY